MESLPSISPVILFCIMKGGSKKMLNNSNREINVRGEN